MRKIFYLVIKFNFYIACKTLQGYIFISYLSQQHLSLKRLTDISPEETRVKILRFEKSHWEWYYFTLSFFLLSGIMLNAMWKNIRKPITNPNPTPPRITFNYILSRTLTNNNLISIINVWSVYCLFIYRSKLQSQSFYHQYDAS